MLCRSHLMRTVHRPLGLGKRLASSARTRRESTGDWCRSRAVAPGPSDRRRHSRVTADRGTSRGGVSSINRRSHGAPPPWTSHRRASSARRDERTASARSSAQPGASGSANRSIPWAARCAANAPSAESKYRLADNSSATASRPRSGRFASSAHAIVSEPNAQNPRESSTTAEARSSRSEAITPMVVEAATRWSSLRTSAAWRWHSAGRLSAAYSSASTRFASASKTTRPRRRWLREASVSALIRRDNVRPVGGTPDRTNPDASGGNGIGSSSPAVRRSPANPSATSSRSIAAGDRNIMLSVALETPESALTLLNVRGRARLRRFRTALSARALDRSRLVHPAFCLGPALLGRSTTTIRSRH
jgi:hypothetical protein